MVAASSTRKAPTGTASERLGRRREPARALAGQAAVIVAACAAMAERFRAGGTLYVLASGAGVTDAEHVAVEFVHPVLVGKRALPAHYLPDAALLAVHAGPGDLALAIGATTRRVESALQQAHERGVLTVLLTSAAAGEAEADYLLRVRGDALVAQEMQVTTYHLLWEIVHVCLEQGDIVPTCGADEQCITCSDQAVPVRVIELLDGALALVDTGRGTEQVSVALVDADAGDTVLVHAGEAIAVVGP